MPHEHVHTDLLPLSEGGDRQVDADIIVDAVLPKLRRARRAGVGLIVECTPPYVGQNVRAVHAACKAAGIDLVVATGLYKEAFQPPWALGASAAELAEWMRSHIEEGIDGTGLRAGFIKLAVTDSGATPAEDKVLEAAVATSTSLGVAVASHCPVGRNALHQLDLLEKLGGDPSRYIQVHANAEADLELHLEILRRGAWIEYDSIGGGASDEAFLRVILRVLDAGYCGRLLLSQDVCGYLVDRAPHGDDREYAYLVESFVPAMREAGVAEGDIDRLVRGNPAKAFSFA